MSTGIAPAAILIMTTLMGASAPSGLAAETTIGQSAYRAVQRIAAAAGEHPTR